MERLQSFDILINLSENSDVLRIYFVAETQI